MDRLKKDLEKVLILSPEQHEQMLEDVVKRAPEEACGLLAGKDNRVNLVISVTNELHSDIRFRMDPVEQLKAFQLFEEQGLDMLGIYHSHPNGPSIPSQTDITEAYYPDVIHLIWSPISGHWICKGFHIIEGFFSEVLLKITFH